MKQRTYFCIDLKSFYGSVECVERGLNPLTTNLVVADISRTEKTICLAVTPPLKAYGISGRARLFEVVQRVKEVNLQRQNKASGHTLTGSSADAPTLKTNSNLALDYIVAKPRMALYIDYSTRIYSVYLKYVAPEDIYPYSIDEVFIDTTNYLEMYHLTAHELAKKMILDVLQTTGITATAGMGTNMYLSKIAMDIVSKHIDPDHDGVRIAKLDEMSYRRLLWDHRPLTDFWRIGKGLVKRLESNGLYTMGDIARCSRKNEALLYKLFGVNAELMIDHAWGYEPVTMSDIKAYKPKSSSSGAGQVLQFPYTFDKAKFVVREMAERLALDLLSQGLVTDQVVLTVGYDRDGLTEGYKGPIVTDRYGRQIPKPAHGSANLGRMTSSGKLIVNAMMKLYDQIVDSKLLIRRLNVVANHTAEERTVEKGFEQIDLFSAMEEREAEEEALVREKSIQKAMLSIQEKYGKNAILKGTSLMDGATAIERNQQIGGHRA